MMYDLYTSKMSEQYGQSKYANMKPQNEQNEKHCLGVVQTSNFSCAEPNVNDLSSLFELIYIRFGT